MYSSEMHDMQTRCKGSGLQFAQLLASNGGGGGGGVGVGGRGKGKHTE